MSLVDYPVGAGRSLWVRIARLAGRDSGPAIEERTPDVDEVPIHIDGAGKTWADATRARLILFVICVVLVYGVIGARLLELGLREPAIPGHFATPQQQIAASRPDIVDRNGAVLATDIPSTAVFADPAVLVDVDEAVDQLMMAMPNLSRARLVNRLSSGSRFEWIARELVPEQREAIFDRGIPGVGFLEENRRFYPGGRLAAHVLGAVSVDHNGLGGIESMIDERLLSRLQAAGFLQDNASDLAPVRLALEARAQFALRDELEQAMRTYQAIAAAGVIIDVRTGEVVSMVSLPDYDPNTRVGLGEADMLNRVSHGVFELGSVFKTFTVAAALDSGAVRMTDRFDATRPITIGRSTIGDFRGQERWLTLPEVFTYSSNIGTIRVAEQMGAETMRHYFTQLGLLDRVETELPGGETPQVPDTWTRIAAATISFGHGVSTTPLQLASAAAAVVNGGVYYPPTFMPRSPEQAAALGRRVLAPETSAHMREIFRLNATDGSGRRANPEGYGVGGKTGTAEKVVNGAYSDDHRLNSYLAAFPMSDPHYVVLIMIDEPQPTEDSFGFATAGWNAVPTTGRIIERVAPFLGVERVYFDDLPR